MRVGTKSLLFGAHAFWLHPWFVAWSWWRQHGFPWDPRLWVAFVVHDWGYWGCPNMDGRKGQQHPFVGARIMEWLFDPDDAGRRSLFAWTLDFVFGRARDVMGSWSWYSFTFYHSRYLAKTYGTEPSALCSVDKVATALEPWWLYVPRVVATGEIHEYRARRLTTIPDYIIDAHSRLSHREWFEGLRDYLQQHWTQPRRTWYL